MAIMLPISTLVPTLNRHASLAKMLDSLAQQSFQPVEMIVVDASTTSETEHLCASPFPTLQTKIIYHKAKVAGAAAQRNQAMAYATQNAILFCDDDITFEADCIGNLWRALHSDASLGGVNAMIKNQRYSTPGQLSNSLFRILHGRHEASYAGKCVGPALNLLPEDDPSLPEVVSVEWLNTTCTLYKREALPDPPFPSHFTGYSYLEDVALSLSVGKKWKLANARTARIFHDSQPGEHKNNPTALAKMELVNRHYVMTRILERRKVTDYLKLALLETFGVVTPLVSLKAWRSLPVVLLGKLNAIGTVVSAKYRSHI